MDNQLNAFVIIAADGRGHIDEFCEAAKQLNLVPIFVTSPCAKLEVRIPLQAKGALLEIEKDKFNAADIHQRLNQLHWLKIVGVVTAVDPYRRIATALNDLLELPDISLEAIQNVQDKYVFREKLKSHGLTSLNFEEFDVNRIEEYIKREQLVKPRSGFASVGVARLKEGYNTADVTQKMIEAMHYVSGDDNSDLASHYMVEDFYQGKEFSFEVVVSASQSFVVGIHEKPLIEADFDTYLETIFVSPALTVEQDALASAVALIHKSNKAFGITEGVCHIEMIYSESLKKWEMLEYNLRIGGAMVNESVLLAHGESLATLWLQSFLARDDQELQRSLFEKLAQYQDRAMQVSSTKINAIRNYFGAPGKTISLIEWEPENSADAFRNHMIEGTALAPIAREYFVATGIWQIEKGQFEQWKNASKLSCQIRYEDE